MTERLQKISFALKSIPEYNGDCNKLSNFVSSVNTVQNLLNTLIPALDEFEKQLCFLTIKGKVTEKALDSIKDLEIQTWDVLRAHLTNNFKEQTNSVTILNELLKIQNIKNPYKLLELTKEKFLKLKSRIVLEENDPGTKIVMIRFSERLIVNNFISTISDPHRNNLATRDPQTINEIEKLLQNDFQYLKQSNFQDTRPVAKGLPNVLPQRFPINNFPSRPINFQPGNTNTRNFAPRQNLKNAQGIRPTPMSTQTRQPLPNRQNYQRPLNHFEAQNRQFGNYKPNYTTRELHNTEEPNHEDDFDTQNEEGAYYYSPVDELENEETPDFSLCEEYPSEPSGNSFLEEGPTKEKPPDIKEKY